MKVQLRAGAELDLLTKDELREELEPFRRLLERQAKAAGERPLWVSPRWIKASEAAELDGAGNGTVEVMRVGNGQEFRIARVLLEVDGYDAANTYAGGGVQLLRDEELESFQGGPLPALLTMPLGTEPRFRNGTVVNVQVISGPPNGRVTATVEGELYIGAP